VPAIAVPAFALTWWLACYLIGRDPAWPAGRRAAGALLAYAAGVAVWTVAPASTAAEVLLTAPALLWAGAAVALLPDFVPERRQIERGWLILSGAFVLITVLVPPAGRLVVLAPLIGGLSLLWRFRDQVEPRMLPVVLTAVAVLYGAALVVLLFPTDLGAPGLAIAAIGLDVLILGYLVAVAEAVDAGERLRPDLSRSLVAAVLGTLLAGGPAIFTMFDEGSSETVTILQFVLVGVVMTAIGLAGRVQRMLDRIAFWSDERLRSDRTALLLLADALPRRRERHRLIATNEADFRRFVRRALENYGDLGRLMRSPLTDLPAVDQRLTGRATGQPPARAVELRTVLQEAVARLRPPGPFATDEQWRHYNALYFSYVLGLQPYRRRMRTDGLDRDTRRVIEWLRGYVPRHLLRRWQAEGVAMVATRLWDDMVSTDPRWLTRVPERKRPTTTRST
jgi:hypothetical protein